MCRPPFRFADVSVDDDVEHMIAKAVREFSSLDVLFAVNLKGVFVDGGPAAYGPNVLGD